MSVSIKEAASGTVLAEGEQGTGVIGYEGNLYFAPETVNQTVLQVTDRTYTCPYKGVCHWVDYSGPDGRTVRDVGWIYHQPKPGHEAIRGRYGFYSSTRGGTRKEET